MQQVTFTLRILTPLFLAGADQTQAELRAPTFRGLMRYWYRALVGGIVGADERTLQQVVDAEKAIFGATDTGSAIVVRVSNASNNPQQYKKESYSRSSTSGKDYLLWSMAESGRGKPNYRSDRLFFPQDTTFQVTLSNRGNDEVKFQSAIASFWLLTHLGGIGSRSRRCAGSISAQVVGDSVDSVGGFLFATPQNADVLQAQLREGIALARQSILSQLSMPSATSFALASFDALTRQTCTIWILRDNRQSWSTSDIAMRTIGASLQDYRSKFDIRDREIFGLPLGRNAGRRASPLLLRVSTLQTGGYIGLATLFKTGNPRQYKLIEDWANSFSGKVGVTF